MRLFVQWITIVVLSGLLFNTSLHQLAHVVSGDHSSHHAHSGSHEGCSAKELADPCHRIAFHFDRSAHCEHDSHLSSRSSTCELCAHAPLRNEGVLPQSEEDVVRKPSVEPWRAVAVEPDYSSVLNAQQDRGPPHTPCA